MQSILMKDAEEKQVFAPHSLPSDQFSDSALMFALARGSASALELLYERYHRFLYSLAYRIVTDQQIAEDMLQDTFVTVWRRASTYSIASGTVRSWLISILYHRTIDYLRVLRRQAVLKKVAWEEVDQDERVALPDVWDETWQSVKEAHVREAVTMLPMEQRQVIEWAYFQGKTHLEIAQTYQLPLGTVKGRMRLGIMHLKQTLERMGLHEA